MKKIGQNIKNQRKNKGLTQKDLAQRIARTESSIRKYEKGLVDIPNKVINEIAEALNISFNDLIGVSEQNEIIAREDTTSNRIVMESVYQLLEEVLMHHSELADVNLNAEEIINADNCYWELLVPEIVNTIKNSVTDFVYRKNHSKLKQRENEIMLNLGKQETRYSNGFVVSGANKLISLAKRSEDKEYLQLQIDELEEKLNSLNLKEK